MSALATPRPMQTLTAAAMAVTLLLAAAGCGDDDGGVFLGVDGESPFPGDQPAASQPDIPDTPEGVATAAIEDVERFWAEAYPSVYGTALEPLADGWHAYDSSNLPPNCGPLPISYNEIAVNAFYCPLGDFIAYDEEGLLPWLWDTFGGFTIAIVMAHEYGHAVQERANELDDHASTASVRIEMQADCYSGAWVGWVAAGNSTNFAISTDQLNNSVAGMLAIRDLPGDDPTHPAAHGSGFDRVSSFQDGYENGVTACAEYTERHRAGDLAITQIPFSEEDYETGGDYPLRDEDTPDGHGLYSAMAAYLDLYFSRFFQEELGRTWEPVDELIVLGDPDNDTVTCGGQSLSGRDELEWFSAYCVDENTVVIDGTTLGDQLWERIGDFAVAAELARLWAFAAQQQLGIDQGLEANLQADCLTGNFGGMLFPDGNVTGLGTAPGSIPILLSAGDLDEAIMSILAYDSARSEESGTVFQRTAAMRAGTLAGIDGRLSSAECAQFHPFD
jgi:predicted metalloprotease